MNWNLIPDSTPEVVTKCGGGVVSGISQGLGLLNRFLINAFHQYQYKITAGKTYGQNDDKQIIMTPGKSGTAMGVT